MQDRGEGTAEAGDRILRVKGVGIGGPTDAEGPRKFRCHLPSVLSVEVKVQEIVWLRVRHRKGLRRGRSHTINELRQGRICNERYDSLAEIIIVEAEDAGIRAETQLVTAVGPSEIVIDEKACCATVLHPGIVQTAECRKRRIRAAPLQHNRESR